MFINKFVFSLSIGSKGINLLPILGFNSESVVSIIYKKLPYILSTVVNGLSDSRIEDKIVQTLKNHTKFNCTDLFDWWSDVRVGLSIEEYTALEKFVCNLDSENFNEYVNFVAVEREIFRIPVSRYRLYMLTVIGDIYDFGKAINKILNTTVTIERPFTKLYFKNVLMKLRDSLEHVESTTFKVN